jgi:nucleotide-binding universal stress UspA family protein
MSIKTILAPLGGTPDCRPYLDVAFELAKAFDAHILGLHIRSDPRAALPYIGEGMTAEVVQQMCDLADREGQARAQAAEALFHDAREAAGVPMMEGERHPGLTATWISRMGDQSEHVALFGRIADLTVVGRSDVSLDLPESGIKEGLLFRSGRPILFVPGTVTMPFPRHVAVAWNGSAEASRAVGNAIPLLKRAEKVEVLHAGETPPGAPSAEYLKAYFTFHGIKARLVEVTDRDSSTGEALLNKTHELGADLLVMGAYTRSRLRQMLLGGVTSHMLEHADLPVFMSH